MSLCAWKRVASYYDVHYRHAATAAHGIEGRVACRNRPEAPPLGSSRLTRTGSTSRAH